MKSIAQSLLVTGILILSACTTSNLPRQSQSSLAIESVVVELTPASTNTATPFAASELSPTPCSDLNANSAATLVNDPNSVTVETLADIQARVPYGIQLPAWLPDGFCFRRDEVGIASDQSWVILEWRKAPLSGSDANLIDLVIRQEEADYVALSGAPAEYIEVLTIHQRPAKLIRGLRNFETQQWEPDRQIALEWQNDGLSFGLAAMGETTSAELLRIAESIP